jgi:phosphoserine phosphatase RsbU/P
VLISRAGAPELLPLAGGLPIGLADTYESVVVSLARGNRLYIYSDGVTEAMGVDGELFGEGRMLQSLAPSAQGDLRTSVDSLLADLRRWRGEAPPHDDLSVIAIEAT